MRAWDRKLIGRNPITQERDVRMRRGVLCLGAITVLGLSLAAGGLAATSPVVPAGGKVAGKGYAYYLQRLMLLNRAHNGREFNCSTVTVGGQKVAMLNAGVGAVQPLVGGTVCSEPAGRAIYVHVWSNACSTPVLQGFQPPFRKSDADLLKCAYDVPLGATRSATLDGHPVNLRGLRTATGVFIVPKTLGGPARAAADGVGILLSGLSKGTHTIQTKPPKSGGPPNGKLPALKVHVT